MKHVLLSLLLSLAGTGAAFAEAVRLSEPVMNCEAFEVFGAPMESTLPGASLASVLPEATTASPTPVRVTTRVAKICQKKGCFFVAQDGAAQARVSFLDYGFFLPTDSAGKTVTLVGELQVQELTAAQTRHFAEDLGEPNPQAAARREYHIVASSVLVPKG